MKMISLRFIAALALLVFSSCDLNNDEPNFYFSSLPIVSVEMPESFVLNETYEIKVTYTLPDNCTTFAGFDVSKQEITTRHVAVVGTVHTGQESCTGEAQVTTASFDFIVIHDQTYLFRFWQGNSSDGEPQFLEVEVPVN